MTVGKKITSISCVKPAQPIKVYDIEVEDAHHYILGDGTVSHNSYVPMKKMGGGCLVERTNIQTPKGLIEIQNLKVGDYVKTLYGNKRITETFKFDDKEVFEIIFDDGSVVKCSGDHKFLISGEWKSIVDLQDSVKNMENINIEVADIHGDLNVYRKQIYENIFFLDGESKAA